MEGGGRGLEEKQEASRGACIYISSVVCTRLSTKLPQEEEDFKHVHLHLPQEQGMHTSCLCACLPHTFPGAALSSEIFPHLF